MATKGQKESVKVDGRTVRFTHPDKVLYEATGTTKADVLEYYTAVAPLLITYAGNRPVTRKRWPDGTDADSFFEKNLPQHAPDWVPSVTIEHSSRTVRYPVLDSPATLAWFAQQAALELHVPQWTLSGGEPGRTRRIVIDLDPGEGVELDTTAKVALRVRDLLSEAGLESFPVTSGSKGIHLYARLDKAVTAASASKVAKEIAQSLAKQTPDLVTATMKRSIRDGKVFVDWSQNSGAKTTVSPYSLRGRAEPWVAAPRSWEELGDGGLTHLHWDEVLKRLDSDGDLLDGLEASGSGSRSGKGSGSRASSTKSSTTKSSSSKKSSSSSTSAKNASSDGPASRGTTKSSGGKKSSSSSSSSSSNDDDDPHRVAAEEGCDTEPTSPDAVVTSLDEYRRKRDRRRTPEPFEGEVETDREDAEGPIFVIQEHHARRLHYDLRLEHHGVLASWAVPKNLPTEPKDRRLAVNTEDHPLGYETFEGTIPKGEYGAGHMTIWDRGWYECEKWREDEIIVWLHGEKLDGRYVLVRTSAEKNQWIAQYMKDQSPDSFYGGRDNPKSSYPDDDKRARGTGGSDGSDSSDGAGDKARSRSTDRSDSTSRPDAPPLPMIPTAAEVTELPDDTWAFEGKWDGYRVTLATDGAQTRLVSRNGNSMDWLADGFPGLAEALERRAVLDAELVILDANGVPDFASLAKQAAAEGKDSSLPPVELFVFDVLEVDGVDLQKQTWERRREVLDLLAPALRAVDRVHVPEVLDGPGDRALAEAEEYGWEGIVAKRRDSKYESGRRSKAWLKQKLLTTTEAVVGGWRPGKGGRSGSLGSLLLGLPAETGLAYIGRVGTGFTDKQARALLNELKGLERKTSPFVEQLPADARREAVWVTPKIVVEVRHQGFTDEGNMRQPSWRDIRRDKLPGDL